MAEVPVPPGYGIPLVDLETKLFPAPTMAAITEHVTTAIDTDLPDLSIIYDTVLI